MERAQGTRKGSRKDTKRGITETTEPTTKQKGKQKNERRKTKPQKTNNHHSGPVVGSASFKMYTLAQARCYILSDPNSSPPIGGRRFKYQRGAPESPKGAQGTPKGAQRTPKELQRTLQRHLFAIFCRIGALPKIMVLLYKYIHFGEWRGPRDAQRAQESNRGHTREGRREFGRPNVFTNAAERQPWRPKGTPKGHTPIIE